MNSKVLVTGASGFVGRELCKELSRRGESVVAIVRESTGVEVLSTQEVRIADLAENRDWSSVFEGVGVVVHLAARVHMMGEKASQNLDDYRALNVDGTERLARAAAAQGVRRFIFLSSIKVNGESTQPGRPYTPDDVPGPVDAYGISKLEAEKALRKLAKETGMEVVIIRPVLVYGPGVKANFRTMMRAMNRGIPLPLGSIDNRRSLVALENLVDLIATCKDHSNAAGQIFLVSDGHDLSTTELLRRTSLALGRSPRLFPMSNWFLRMAARIIGKTDFVERLCGSLQVDITKTRTLLNWDPPVKLDVALEKAADSFLATEMSLNRDDGPNKQSW